MSMGSGRIAGDNLILTKVVLYISYFSYNYEGWQNMLQRMPLSGYRCFGLRDGWNIKSVSEKLPVHHSTGPAVSVIGDRNIIILCSLLIWAEFSDGYLFQEI